jgi:hypothetical protein
MSDTFEANKSGLDSPAKNAFAVTPHDTNALTSDTRGIYIGGAGDMVLITSGGETVTFVGLPAGFILPVRANVIKATGTTATSIVGLY